MGSKKDKKSKKDDAAKSSKKAKLVDTQILSVTKKSKNNSPTSKNTSKKHKDKNVIDVITDKAPRAVHESPFSDELRVGEGFNLKTVDPSSTPGWSKGHKAAEELMAETADELADLQERLYAAERHEGGRSVLLIVQGMDTSGKGGIMRHVVGHIDPQGVKLTSFKAPTKEESAHPFLWRIRNALPEPGYIGVFDRSQYEDVLIVRVHDLVSRPVWMRRYGQINTFEATAAAKGMTIIKVMLHISANEQKKRLEERLDNPEKLYKFNPGDLREREFWSEYQEAYQAALMRTSTEEAPWFVVPADNKWYARLAVEQLLLEHLRAMDLEWPKPEFDVTEQKEILARL